MANTRKNSANAEDTSRQVHNTNTDGSTNPNATEETIMTQPRDVNPLEDATQAVTPSNAQMARELQEATKTMKEFMAMMVQLMPGMAASAAAQQGVALPQPATAAQQRATQTFQPLNPPLPASTDATHGDNQQARTPGPMVAQHSASEARSIRTQPGGSSSSPVIPQFVMSKSTSVPNNSTSEVRNTGIQIGDPSFSHAAP